MTETVHIIGAGLAGSEAAYQLGKRGFDIKLYEMKPLRFSPAHKLEGPAELVCSNSLGSDSAGTAPGLLKAELRMLDSLILKAASESKVPAGSALAVNRQDMCDRVKYTLSSLPNVELIVQHIDRFPQGKVLVATGPLTSDELAENISELTGQRLFFFDATSPIVDTESIDRDKVYAASRYDKGDPDYLNCPLDEETYYKFIEEIKFAKLVTPHDFDNLPVFEGCMPIEQIVARGDLTLAHGPLRPVGLPDPKTGKIPFAVVQLRKENVEGSAYNLVGFQTRMTWSEQARVFRMIPGLESADFLRFGVMHRNTYIQSPKVLNKNFALKSDPRIVFAGQLIGVEGYMESTAMGLLAALMLAYPNLELPPAETMLGALSRYVVEYEGKNFQPMAANFGLVPPLKRRAPKKKRKELYHIRGLEKMTEWIKENSVK